MLNFKFDYYEEKTCFKCDGCSIDFRYCYKCNVYKSGEDWLASIEALEALAEDEIGGSPGGCGTAVYFYDCYGAQIAENDFTRSIPCQ